MSKVDIECFLFDRNLSAVASGRLINVVTCSKPFLQHLSFNPIVVQKNEGIRTLEILAPYYGDRVRQQFPPSSRILTLIKVRVSSLFVFTPLFPRATCDTLSSTRC
jgi:hypothetical protein